MTYKRDWDKNKPEDHLLIAEIPQVFRWLKEDIAERLKDWIYGFISGESKIGLKKAPLVSQSSDPATESDKGILYVKEIEGIKELFYRDSSGNVIQLTENGELGGVVKLTGDQTIEGIKTFVDGVIDPKFAEIIPIKRLNVWLDTADLKTIRINAEKFFIDKFYFDTVSLSLDPTVVGVGGIDTVGPEDDAWYYIYLIVREDKTINVIASKNWEEPTLPSGYIYYRLIGCFYIDNADNIGNWGIAPFYQIQNQFFWGSYNNYTNITGPGDNNAHNFLIEKRNIPRQDNGNVTVCRKAQLMLTYSYGGGSVEVLSNFSDRPLSYVGWFTYYDGKSGDANTRKVFAFDYCFKEQMAITLADLGSDYHARLYVLSFWIDI